MTESRLKVPTVPDPREGTGGTGVLQFLRSDTYLKGIGNGNSNTGASMGRFMYSYVC